MNLKTVFQSSRPINVGLIGMGAFGGSFLFQARAIPKLNVVAVCDRQVDIARQACLRAGMPEAKLAVCATEAEAQSAIKSGQTAIVEDAAVMAALPVEVVVEATGMPEAGARHGKLAIEQGKHVVMVSKEVDSVVGPILTHLAQASGLVYTQADGDQPSMLIGLISWAESLGFEILCAGKSGEVDFVYDLDAATIKQGKRTINLPDNGRWPLWTIPEGQVSDIIEQRKQSLREEPHAAVPNLCEMAIVMNATGYGFDTPRLHAPIVRTPELPEVLGSRSSGGVLETTGVIDIVNCLRRSDEASFAGGVFVVVACHDADSWQMLKGKGHLVSQDLSRAVIYLPYHLLGVETATSIFAAAYLNQPTGGVESRPQVDMVALTSQPLKAGQPLTMQRNHVIPGLEPELMAAQPMVERKPIPYYMAAENTLKVDVPAGMRLTYEMINRPPDSALWALREQQDKHFHVT